jgi:hypothetical protein
MIKLGKKKPFIFQMEKNQISFANFVPDRIENFSPNCNTQIIPYRIFRSLYRTITLSTAFFHV